MQAGVRVDVPGKRLHDGLFVAHNPSLDPLRQPGTALGGAALFSGKLGAERTVNVFRLVLECVDIQRLVSFPGQQMKKLSQSGKLDEDTMLGIMSEEKKPEVDKIVDIQR